MHRNCIHFCELLTPINSFVVDRGVKTGNFSHPGFIIHPTPAFDPTVPVLRLLLLAFMIALLPLRGWVGDVMAMERVSQALTTTSATAASGDCHEAMVPHGQADTQHESRQPAVAQDAAHASGDCGSCTACQICHSVALAGLAMAAPAAASATPAPQTQARLHASVERAPGFKPPIS